MSELFLHATMLVTIALLLVVRHRDPLPRYGLAVLILLVIFLTFALFVPDWTFYARGPLCASGFRTSALVFAFALMATVCALPPWKVWRFFQPPFAYLTALYWIAGATWIA